MRSTLVGVDEVGRGPLAGPVAVGVVALGAGFDMTLLHGVRDSKQLSEKKRDEWEAKAAAWQSDGLLTYTVGFASASTIDREGIAVVIRQLVARGLEGLEVDSSLARVLLDGSLSAPKHFIQETIIGGDDSKPVISLASIVAKVARDRHMQELEVLYPQYGLAKHKGYGTVLHIKAIRTHGLTPEHRRSFCGNFI